MFYLHWKENYAEIDSSKAFISSGINHRDTVLFDVLTMIKHANHIDIEIELGANYMHSLELIKVMSVIVVKVNQYCYDLDV
jgi:hypothetical protein